MKLKQINSGSFMGSVLDTYGRAATFFTITNMIMLAATFYNTTGQQYFKPIFPWLSFTVFMLLLSLSFILFMVIVYIFITPSSMSFFNHQTWNHDNPMRKELIEIKEDIKKIYEKLEIK
jgi:hypothetical protein